MNYPLVSAKIIEIFQKYKIKSFPIDCEYLVKEMGCKIYRYSELSEEKRNSCLLVSDESMKIRNRIYYNDKIMSEGRARFSIIHELGHIVLEHGEYRNEALEAEANYFASHILAPRMAIHYAGCENHIHVAKQFNLSYEAAQYAFDDYRRWHRQAAYKMGAYDKLMYQHFYDDDYEKFVYSRRICKLCGNEIVNSATDYCISCFNKLSYADYYKDDLSFKVAENQWLYGGL